jgi:hypothetical protein
MSAFKEMNREVIREDGEEAGYLPDNDNFYTLTMAEILERQGLKEDALRVYQALLGKKGQNSLIITHRIKRLAGSDSIKGYSLHNLDERRKSFDNWLNKLKGEGS